MSTYCVATTKRSRTALYQLSVESRYVPTSTGSQKHEGWLTNTVIYSTTWKSLSVSYFFNRSSTLRYWYMYNVVHLSRSRTSIYRKSRHLLSSRIFELSRKSKLWKNNGMTRTYNMDKPLLLSNVLLLWQMSVCAIDI